jgi:hypothetical protein
MHHEATRSSRQKTIMVAAMTSSCGTTLSSPSRGLWAAKKHQGPSRVEHQLSEEQDQPNAAFWCPSPQPQNPPNRKRHQQIERRPNRREDPIRRVECGSDEARIPGSEVRVGGYLVDNRGGGDRDHGDHDETRLTDQCRLIRLHDARMVRLLIWISAVHDILNTIREHRSIGPKKTRMEAEAMTKNSRKPKGVVAKSQQVEAPKSQGGNELSVLQKGNRLQITADVDLEGIGELKDILGHYEAILKRLSVQKPPSSGVSFLITHHQKAELRERGFTDDQIHAMTPEEAHRLLGLGD